MEVCIKECGKKYLDVGLTTLNSVLMCVRAKVRTAGVFVVFNVLVVFVICS